MKKILIFLIMLASPIIFSKDNVEIKNAWVREMIPGIRNSSAYFIIYNPTKEILKLQNAQSAYFETVELHSHSNIDGIMRMRKLDYVLIPARGFVEFKMMSNHLMLFGLKETYEKVKVGDKIPFTLVFKNKDKIKFNAIVKKPNL